MSLMDVQPLPPVSPRAWLAHSHSSHVDLCHCEKRYWFKKIARLPAEPTKAMSKGLFVHQLLADWWDTGTFDNAINEFTREWALERTIFDEETGEVAVQPIPDWVDDMLWLVARYAEYYGPSRDEYTVVATERPWKIKLPGRYAYLTGRWDILLRDRQGRLWVVEWKTMSDWDSLEQYAWSPQLSLYYWAAVEEGLEPFGLLLDALKTYRWVKPRPLEDSFERRWLDRSPEHLRQALREAEHGMVRARELHKGAYPLRNVTRECGWCPYREPCRAELAFGPEFPLDIEED